jgi:hypothetical protein
MVLIRTGHPYLRVGCYHPSLENLSLLGLIRCQGNHDDYACLCDGVAMSGGDKMGSSAQVHGTRCTWVLVATSYHVSLYTALLVQGSSRSGVYPILESPRCDYRGSGPGNKEDV